MMSKYVAFLRAINVGGNSVMKMDDLKRMFKSFGLDEVQTYIQSGNVIFESTEDNAACWRSASNVSLKKPRGTRSDSS
jgi:uncharacterized protein (DUF1697 family)